MGFVLFNFLAPFNQSALHPLRILIVWSLGGGIFTWAVEHVPPYLAFHIGLSQSHVVPIVSLASYGGLHLVNAFIVFVNLCFYLLFFNHPWSGPTWKKCGLFGTGGLILALLLLVVLGRFSFETKTDRSLLIALVQPQAEPFDFTYGWLEPHRLDRLRKNYDVSMENIKTECPDIVIWPENGDGTYLLRNPQRLKFLSERLMPCQTWGIFSTVDWDGFHKTNTVFSLSPIGKVTDRYDKQRLTIMEKRGGFVAGDGTRVIGSIQGLKVGVLICFESIFALLARERYEDEADILLISASDTPFFGGVLRSLHAAYAPFRASEIGLPVIRSAVTGPSYWINSKGKILQTISSAEQGMVTFSLPLSKQKTFFMAYGKHLWSFLSFCLLVGICIRICLFNSKLHPFRGAFLAKPKALVINGILFLIVPLFFGLMQWWPHGPKFQKPLPDGQERVKKILAVDPSTSLWKTSLLALSLYGYEDPIKNKNGIFSSKSLESILKFFEGQGFRPILKKQVSVEDLKNWPLPSLLLFKINDELRPVTLINFLSSQGVYVFDPRHPNGFVSVSSSELSQYFAGEGIQLFPP